MSSVALLNESIPHMFASLLTHVLATGWSVFQILHTADFRSSFNKAVTFGTCKGVALLPTYWSTRARAEFPTLALNCLSLLVSAFLTWKLVKVSTPLIYISQWNAYRSSGLWMANVQACRSILAH